MNPSIIILLVGIFTLICILTKPAFYWESRKARRLRRFIGDGGATIVYLILGIFFIGFSISNLLGFTSF